MYGQLNMYILKMEDFIYYLFKEVSHDLIQFSTHGKQEKVGSSCDIQCRGTACRACLAPAVQPPPDCALLATFHLLKCQTGGASSRMVLFRIINVLIS